MYTQI